MKFWEKLQNTIYTKQECKHAAVSIFQKNLMNSSTNN